MCRFLLAKSVTAIKPADLLPRFAIMSEKSKALDGDWQGDGWGITYLNESNEWISYHSLKPVWKDSEIFSTFPATHIFLVHARSASFPSHKGVLAYNQPFTDSKYAYVFNGLLKGVSLPSPVAGAIGSQKIWNLLRQDLQKQNPAEAIKKTFRDLQLNTKTIQAFNLGFSDKKNIYAFCAYHAHPEYYNLQSYNAEGLSLICSETLEGFHFEPVPKEEIVIY